MLQKIASDEQTKTSPLAYNKEPISGALPSSLSSSQQQKNVLNTIKNKGLSFYLSVACVVPMGTTEDLLMIS